MNAEKGVFPIINRDGTYTMKEATRVVWNPDEIARYTLNENDSITVEFKNGEEVVMSSEYLKGVLTFKYGAN